MGKKKVTFAKQGVIYYTYGDNNSQVKKALSHQVSRRIYKKVVSLRQNILLYYWLNF
jgi:hypothetical protein